MSVKSSFLFLLNVNLIQSKNLNPDCDLLLRYERTDFHHALCHVVVVNLMKASKQMADESLNLTG